MKIFKIVLTIIAITAAITALAVKPKTDYQDPRYRTGLWR